MRRLLIVSHTPSDNTVAMTDAVVRGASHPDVSGVDVRCLRPADAGPDDVLAADGVILGTTENFGYMSGMLKDFLERIYYPCLDETGALPYCLFVKAGNDGRGAVASMERIITGLTWKAVQQPLICRGDYTERCEHEAEELGMTMAAGLEAGIF
jgi:multimeric flavodoxin WrbA